MEYKSKEIKEGIKLHLINNEKFKTNLVTVILTTELKRENVTKNAIIPAILRRGSETMPTQEAISMQMEEMYGASFNCGVNKKGDNQILKFYMESINDSFLPDDEEDMLSKTIKKLFEIIFRPLVKDGGFNQEYIEQEKENLKQIIQGKIDNKANYAITRCSEEMFGEKPYALYKFGYEEDLNDIEGKSLYEYYNQLLQKCKIDILVSGIIDESISNKIEEMSEIKNLKPRKPAFVMPTLEVEPKNNERVVKDSMDVTQGKLVLGLNVKLENEGEKYDALIYNAVLGGTANSKLFQNVREKASLAYTAGSSYLKDKNVIFIKCGIEISNFEKALNIVREQLQQMKEGDFTDHDIEVAKNSLIDAVQTIDDEQDTEVMYFFGQEFSHMPLDIQKYVERVKNVNKDAVLKIAQSVSIDTIYFLRN